MPSPENKLPRTSLIEIALEGIADWVSKYRRNFGLDNQLGLCAPDEVIRVARDLRLTPSELQELARKGPNAADLLLKMLVALHVDPKALENTDPHVMRDLQRLCTTCGAKKRCERELANRTAGDHFREFCPNAFTLDALLDRNGQPSGQ
ncbi:hypothetical protein [Mycobacterium sp.]|uniref:hypothetical protein n=1 Tax=Mycobacterium sp. TaxID=1785 RepID=UPI003C71CE31